MAIVIVTFNSERHIKTLARSLREGLNDVPNYRLVVVDNASTDATVNVTRRELPKARLIEMQANRGYAAGINAALHEIDMQDAVLILNPDIKFYDHCIPRLLDSLEDMSVGIAVPRLLSRGQDSFSLRREPSVSRIWCEAILGGRISARLGASEIISDPKQYRDDQNVDWATGAVMMISPSCRRKVGAWDETYFLYSEEVDYCARTRAAGLNVRYVAEARAEHVGGEYSSNPELWRILVRNRIKYFRNTHGPVAAAMFQLGLLMNESMRAVFSPGHRAGLRATMQLSMDTSRPYRPDLHGFIWFAAQDWWYHNQAHSDFQLMREIARSQTVLVVNSLGLRIPTFGVSSDPLRRIARKLRSTAKFVRRPIAEIPGFHVMTPILLPFYGDGPMARLNTLLIRLQVQTVAAVLGIGPKPSIGVTIPTAWPVVRRMRRSSLIFNRSDLHSAFPEANGKWVASLELRLMEKSDAVLYVSHELMRNDRDIVGNRGHFLDHGVDLDHFTPGSPMDVDPEILGIPEPRIGFFGGIDDYVVDIDLLRKTALSLPSAQLVLVGDATCPMDDLVSLPNVHWLGYRPYESIPRLGRGFNVAIMPWLRNEWIRFANPIKLKEYLALGLPVVTTEYPEVEGYRDQVRVADSPEEFVALIKDALTDPGDREIRREFVMDYSWRTRAQALADIAHSTRRR